MTKCNNIFAPFAVFVLEINIDYKNNISCVKYEISQGMTSKVSNYLFGPEKELYNLYPFIILNKTSKIFLKKSSASN